MDTHLYLSMIPESLVASMLPPEQFGTYLAIGTHTKSHGQAIFFDLAGEFPSDAFDFSVIPQRCVPHPDGQPKRSVYLAVYRILERVPLSAVNSLWLATSGGHVLELKQGHMPSESPGKYHLYQEICPVHPLVVSSPPPDGFRRFLTDPAGPIYAPRICFVDLELAELAEDPEHADVNNLPYAPLDHLRDCLKELRDTPDKHTKNVDRKPAQEFPYRCVKTGFYVGDREEMRFFPFPSREELETTHFSWWRFANR